MPRLDPAHRAFSAVVGKAGPMLRRIPSGVSTVRSSGAALFDSLPDEVRGELASSVKRLASVRSPSDVRHVAEQEISRLSRTIVPVLAAHPLPVRTESAAKLAAGSTAALAAAFAEVDEIAVLVTAGVAAPTLPTAFAALLGAFVVEVWAATSLRVHQLEDADRSVDLELLADEVTAAVLGTNVLAVRQLAGRATVALSKRVGKRMGASLVPFAGVAVDSWGATRTIRAMARMDVTAHPSH